MSYRAILIPVNQPATWINLADDGAAIRNTLGGWCDLSVIHRNTDRHGPGVNLAVGEFSLLDGSPHNDLASAILAALGRNYHAHGPALLLGLNGPETVDLTAGQWELLAKLAEVSR